MNIHQLSVSYMQEQDRLLIRINGREGGELRAWLTRRLGLALLPVLSRSSAQQIQNAAAASLATAAPGGSADTPRARMLAAFESEAALRGGDFETPYQAPQGSPAQPSQEPEPLLLTEAKVSLLAGGQLHLHLLEKLPGQDAVRQFEVSMDPPLSNALLQLLHRAIVASEWLQAPAMPAADLAGAAITAAELAAAGPLPKYLN